MSSPFISFSDASSCSPCPAGTIVSSLTSVPNDEISCELCPRGKSSTAGSTSCDLTTIQLPNGNGYSNGQAQRVGSLGGVVDDILGSDVSKKEAATKTYGPIENWDVTEVTDISYLFQRKGTMNADLSSWDVSRVTNMQGST